MKKNLATAYRMWGIGRIMSTWASQWVLNYGNGLRDRLPPSLQAVEPICLSFYLRGEIMLWGGHTRKDVQKTSYPTAGLPSARTFLSVRSLLWTRCPSPQTTHWLIILSCTLQLGVGKLGARLREHLHDVSWKSVLIINLKITFLTLIVKS